MANWAEQRGWEDSIGEDGFLTFIEQSEKDAITKMLKTRIAANVAFQESHVTTKPASKRDAKKVLEKISGKKKEAAPAKPAKAAKPAKKAAKRGARGAYDVADGTVQFLEHRKAWVGFWAGKRVVMKGTEKAAREWMAANYSVLGTDK